MILNKQNHPSSAELTGTYYTIIINFCFYYKFKFYFPEILSGVGVADIKQIKPPKLKPQNYYPSPKNTDHH